MHDEYDGNELEFEFINYPSDSEDAVALARRLFGAAAVKSFKKIREWVFIRPHTPHGDHRLKPECVAQKKRSAKLTSPKGASNLIPHGVVVEQFGV